MITNNPRKSDSLTNLAEKRFARLLEQRRCAYWTEDELEQQISVHGTRPDFFVRTDGNISFLAEVESFEEPTTALAAGNFSHFNPEESIRRITTAVKHAARQLRPYKALNIPTLVVLDNWRLIDIPSNIGFLRQALFGVMEFRVRFDASKGMMVEDPRLHHGGGQTLHPARKRYISAVAWNMPKLLYAYSDPLDESPMRLQIVHNDFASRPLPIRAFNDGEDEHYSYDEDGRWKELNAQVESNTNDRN